MTRNSREKYSKLLSLEVLGRVEHTSSFYFTHSVPFFMSALFFGVLFSLWPLVVRGNGGQTPPQSTQSDYHLSILGPTTTQCLINGTNKSRTRPLQK